MGDQSLNGARAVVIGAGVSGLSAAIALSSRGARVRVLEQSDAPGGQLKPLQHEGVFFHTGEHFFTHPRVLGRLFVRADLRLSDFLEFHPLDPPARLILPDDQNLDVHRELADLALEVARFSKEDAARLRKRASSWEQAGRQLEEAFVTSPPGAFRAFTQVLQNPLTSVQASRLLSPFSLGQALRRFKSPALPALFEYVACRWGASIHQLPAGAAPLLWLEHQRGSWRPEGGLEAVTSALARVCALRNIRIVTGARVEAIDLKNRRVRRVRGEGFKNLKADLVVSTMNPLRTLRMMDKNPEIEDYMRDVESYKASRSALVFCFQSVREWHELDRIETVIMPAEPKEASRQIDTWEVPASDPMVRIYKMPGREEARKQIIAVIDVPPLSNRYRWNEETISVERQRVFAIFKKLGMKDFADYVEHERVVTPADWSALADLVGGSLYGASMNERRGLITRVPHRCEAVGGLHFAGRWTHPGPSAASAIQSGMLAAESALY